MKKDITFYFKWTATITLIVGTAINSLGFYPLGPIILIMGGFFGWWYLSDGKNLL